MRYFTNNEGNPMSNDERLQKYPSGKCPLCNAQDWYDYYDPEESESGMLCNSCDTQYPMETGIVKTGADFQAMTTPVIHSQWYGCYHCSSADYKRYSEEDMEQVRSIYWCRCCRQTFYEPLLWFYTVEDQSTESEDQSCIAAVQGSSATKECGFQR